MNNANKVDNMSHHSIALHGAYYGQNFGDILLMRIFSRYIRRADPAVRVVLPMAPPGHCELIGADATGLKAFSSCRALLFGGGGYLGERPRQRLLWALRNYRHHVGLAHRARKLGIPWSIVGVGFGPLTDQWMRRAVVAMCNEAQIFAVRDAESVALAVAYGIPRHHIIETADAALALTSDDLNEKAQEEIAADLSPLQGTRMIGLHLSSPSEAEKHAVPMVSKLLDRISSQSDYTLVIFNDSPGEPIPRAYRKLISQHENSLKDRMIKLFYKSVDHQLALLQQLNVVMTNKLHVGICASAFGKQVLSIPLHTKIIRFYRQINKENNCIMPQDLPKLDIFDKITDMISTGPVVLPTSIRERALMNRDLIEQYMCNIMTRE